MQTIRSRSSSAKGRLRQKECIVLGHRLPNDRSHRRVHETRRIRRSSGPGILFIPKSHVGVDRFLRPKQQRNPNRGNDGIRLVDHLDSNNLDRMQFLNLNRVATAFLTRSNGKATLNSS